MPRERSEETLKKTVENHIAYEWKMLWHTYSKILRAYREDRKLTNDDYESIDAFLLHYRNLADFLAPPDKPNKGYVLAKHYGREFVASRPPKTHHVALHNYVAHLTYTRNVPKRWPVLKMANELWNTWSEFARYMEREHSDRAVWFGHMFSKDRKTACGFAPEGLVLSTEVVVSTSSQDHPHVTTFEPAGD